jgi:hypothetical protein
VRFHSGLSGLKACGAGYFYHPIIGASTAKSRAVWGRAGFFLTLRCHFPTPWAAVICIKSIPTERATYAPAKKEKTSEFPNPTFTAFALSNGTSRGVKKGDT